MHLLPSINIRSSQGIISTNIRCQAARDRCTTRFGEEVFEYGECSRAATQSMACWDARLVFDLSLVKYEHCSPVFSAARRCDRLSYALRKVAVRTIENESQRRVLTSIPLRTWARKFPNAVCASKGLSGPAFDESDAISELMRVTSLTTLREHN